MISNLFMILIKPLTEIGELFKKTLYKLSNNLNKKSITSNKAFCLFRSMNCLETTFMSLF